MRGLEGKTVVVTGGGGGIGGATCRRFAEAGAKVAVFDIDPASAERMASSIAGSGGTARAFACDITDHDATVRAVAAAEEALGPVGVLVNGAGWDVFRLFKDSTPAEWHKLIAVNLVGALNMTHAVLPGMVARGAGRFVNIASDAARVGSSGEAVYAACKAGLVGFSKTLAREHARRGIAEIMERSPKPDRHRRTLIQRRQREHPRHRRFGDAGAGVLLRERGEPGGRARLRREAQARLPQIPEMGVA